MSVLERIKQKLWYNQEIVVQSSHERKEMTYKLFIDDERFPVTDDWVIARSSDEAIKCVIEKGLPKHINFDHDLGGEDTSMKFIHWLIDHMISRDLRFSPSFTWDVHSQNPVGADNIRSLMTHFVNNFSLR